MMKALSITSPAVGQVIGSDGKNYAANASLPDGVNKIAVIVNVDGSHGLALALQNAGKMTWANANTAATNATPKFSNATWRVPTNDDWWKIFGQTGDFNPSAQLLGSNVLPGYILNAGGDNFQLNEEYWSSSEKASDNAWTLQITFSNGSALGFQFSNLYKGNSLYVRLCLAF